MRGLILTCKHHDGFFLWPSDWTEHTVARSPWRNGTGDVVREIAAACRRHGLAFGVYLSPWDRNHEHYGRPEYVTYYRRQLRELLTRYSPIYELWFDGANGGDGYYGGARETRRIDRGSYYGWGEILRLVRELQPGCVVFSDAGPDVRWLGNERGIASDPCWATYTPQVRQGESHAAPGTTRWQEGTGGHRDVQSLMGLRRVLDRTFAQNLVADAKLTASDERGPAFVAERVRDGDRDTYWCTSDAVTAASLVATFARPVTFDVVDVREYLPLGQRVEVWALDRWRDGEWVEFAAGEAIGSRRLWRGEPLSAERVRLRVAGPACPAISEFGLYRLQRAAPIAAPR